MSRALIGLGKNVLPETFPTGRTEFDATERPKKEYEMWGMSTDVNVRATRAKPLPGLH